MSDLRARLHDTLDPQHTDLSALAAGAQQQGTRLRRRRRATQGVGSLAMAAVLGVGVVVSAQQLGGPPETRQETGFASPAEATVPASGRSVAAAAVAAVDQVAEGTVDRLYGGVMSPVTDEGAESGEDVVLEYVGVLFAFTPAGASSPGEVSVDVMHRLRPGGPTFETCPERAVDCETSTLPDGSTMHSFRTIRDDVSGDPAGFETVQAMRTMGDVIVSVSAASGLHSPILKGADLPNQPGAVLSVDQVEEITSQPWWGVELPAEYAGDNLSSYEQLPGGAGSL